MNTKHKLNRNLSQLDIETLFQQDDTTETIVAFEDKHLDTYRDALLDVIKVYIKDADVLTVMEINYDILAIIGNIDSGTKYSINKNGNLVRLDSRLKISNIRDIEFYSLVKGLIKKPEFSKLGTNRAKLALAVIGFYDTILYDMFAKNVNTDDGWKNLKYCRVEFHLTSNTQELKHSLPPMIEQPNDWTESSGGGYLLNDRLSPILNRGKKQQPQRVLATLNKLQSYSWSHNINIQREYDYTLAKFIEEGDAKHIANRKTNAMYNSAEAVYDLVKDRDIHFQYKFDARGRTYSTGYDINPQGSQVKKGALRPTQDLPGQNEILTERGLVWLKRMVANHYGLDKAQHQDQELWFDNNIAYIVKDFESYFNDAEEPFQFKLAVEDYMTYLRGQPVTNYAHLDCSNQALQVYGVLTGDSDTSALGNLSGNDIRLDGYQIVADSVNTTLGAQVYVRKDTKKPTMKSLYGYTKGALDLHPKLEQFGINLDPDTFQDIFDKAMRSIASGAMETMDALQNLNKADIGTYCWTLPDGFRVQYDVKSRVKVEATIESRAGLILIFEDTVQVYQASEFSRGMAPNIIHSVDGYIFRELVRRLPYSMVGIHDDYGIHYNHVDELVTTYKTILKEILNSDLLQSIIDEIGTTKMVVTKSTTLTEEMIDNSAYALS